MPFFLRVSGSWKQRRLFLLTVWPIWQNHFEDILPTCNCVDEDLFIELG